MQADSDEQLIVRPAQPEFMHSDCLITDRDKTLEVKYPGYDAKSFENSEF
jgi:hypothetical protein